MVLDVEEVDRAQMSVALLMLGVEAVGVDRQLDRRIGAQVQPALVAREPALDFDQTVEVAAVDDQFARRPAVLRNDRPFPGDSMR